MATRYANRTQSRLEHTLMVSTLLLAVAHNDTAYLRAKELAQTKKKMKLERIKNFLQGIIR